MINYSELSIHLDPFQPLNEICVVWLSEIGFESFTEEAHTLKAYIPEDQFSLEKVQSVLNQLKDHKVTFHFTHTTIPAQNWNSVWEAGFEPVLTQNLSIVAPFHGKEFRNNRVIEIEPKMSFGTGHHQTTLMMCEAMEFMPLKDKKVLDVGAGTGILAINAEQLGAKNIVAVEIEPWSVENCVENAERNHCQRILTVLGGIEDVTETGFDVILANINRNVLMAQLPEYVSRLISQGILAISGFFTMDISDLTSLASSLKLKLISTYEKDQWACLVFSKH